VELCSTFHVDSSVNNTPPEVYGFLQLLVRQGSFGLLSFVFMLLMFVALLCAWVRWYTTLKWGCGCGWAVVVHSWCLQDSSWCSKRMDVFSTEVPDSFDRPSPSITLWLPGPSLGSHICPTLLREHVLAVYPRIHTTSQQPLALLHTLLMFLSVILQSGGNLKTRT